MVIAPLYRRADWDSEKLRVPTCHDWAGQHWSQDSAKPSNFRPSSTLTDKRRALEEENEIFEGESHLFPFVIQSLCPITSPNPYPQTCSAPLFLSCTKLWHKENRRKQSHVATLWDRYTLVSLFHRWANWGTERLNDLPYITQPVSGGARF